MTNNALLTVPEVAARLRINRATVVRWIKDGTLPAVRVGRDYRVEEPVLVALIDRSRTSGGAA